MMAVYTAGDDGFRGEPEVVLDTRGLRIARHAPDDAGV